MQSKTLTILMADIQGYTSRTSRQSLEENALFIKEIRAFMGKHIRHHGGKLVKSMGDGFLVTFESPTNAVFCGQAIQQGVERRNANVLDTNHFIKIRVGISTGEVNIDETGDVFGDAVNIAARIEGFADPNGVFIAESTYLAMNKSELNAMDLGPQQFKNVMQEIRVYRVMAGQVDVNLLQTKERKNKIPSSYKFLGIGLSCGVLLALVLFLILMPFTMNAINQQKDNRHDANETGISLEGIASRSMADQEDSLLMPAVDRDSTGLITPDTEPSLSIDKMEIADLIIEVKILEWLVKKENRVDMASSPSTAFSE